MSVNRLRKFLQGEELDPDSVDRSDEPVIGMLAAGNVVYICVIMSFMSGGEGAVDIKEGSFAWDTPGKPILSK